MSQMELRSSRSRSTTPFPTQEFTAASTEEQTIKMGNNHTEKTVVTRSTSKRSTVIKSNEKASSSTDEINTSTRTSSRKPSVSKSDRTLRSRLIKTSDYSSEDGENEVSTSSTSSSKIIKQNEKNQFVEDARNLITNGSDKPALELYKKSGRYWDVFPKTDWTYSYHSKDRVEIAPGVVAMPNMSRKTIHPLENESNRGSFQYFEEYSNKSTNTEDSLRYRSSKNEISSQDFQIRRPNITRWSTFKRTIITIFLTIFSVFSLIARVQTAIFSQIHRFASQIMLWDTYLLWKSRPGQKSKKLALLCLLPLLLLSGFFFLNGLGFIWETFANNNNNIKDAKFKQLASSHEEDKINFQHHQEPIIIEEKIIKITEKIYLEPPSAGEIARNLSEEQLQLISKAVKGFLNLDESTNNNKEKNKLYNTEEMIEKIINNPSFINVVNNNINEAVKPTITENDDAVNKQQLLINKLLTEIEEMKQQIQLNHKLRGEEYAKLSLNIKKCCEKRPIINYHGYVSRIVKDLLNNPEFLQNQRGLNSWLQSLFIAKENLELRLGNLTKHLDEKYNTLIASNAQILMNQISQRLVELELNNRAANNNALKDGGNIDENIIKSIVNNALKIYDADRTGLVDYAMESMGGQVLTTRCTEVYHHGKAVVSILGVPLWKVANSPRKILTPTIAPGDCWAFQNFPGYIVVKLSNKIRVDAFSLEHISKLLMPEGNINSAPKDFEIYGLKEENDKEPVLLGIYQFNYFGESLQFFPVNNNNDNNQIFDIVEIRILSNHGNPNYTCLYRFRVHGKLYHEENNNNR